MKNLIILIAILFSFSACQKESFELNNSSENKFFLEVDEAILPVIVRGNTESKTFCIILHGGPGDSGIQSFYATNTFNEIEEDCAVVYYDQRCAGLSQGNCNAKELSIDQFVSDIDKMIVLLQHHYGQDISLFILGHSWGATLALDYLINGTHKDQIKGCIQSNGSHNIPMLSGEQKKIMLEYAEEQINLGNSTAEWQRIIDNVKDLSTEEFTDRISIVIETYKTLQPLIDAQVVTPASVKIDNIYKLISNVFITDSNERINNNEEFYEGLLAYDNTKELKAIMTPMSLLWGRHDLVHPPIMVETIFNELGSEEKELHFFEKSHHAPMMHENELFQEKVIDFIFSYK